MFDDYRGAQRDPQEQLDWVYQLMKEMSVQTDPQQMVRAYGKRLAGYMKVDGSLSLSRRELSYPEYRITRFSGWQQTVNPWKQRDRLPLLSGGILADLIYGDEPKIIDDLQLAADDPAAPYLRDQRSLMVIPMLDGGVALNMVIVTRSAPSAFRITDLPNHFWLTNLFGRATSNLVLKEQVATAYEALDRENRLVGEIQRSLLPREMPTIEGLQLAATYQTSQRAGGDYYDFFPLPDGKWGILIADVSGHGPSAAVVMAITHSIAHLYPNQSSDPADLLSFVNRHLCDHYMEGIEAFVTAFYGIYDPVTRELTYSSAGHNPPILRLHGSSEFVELSEAASYPLGVDAQLSYESAVRKLETGDCLVLYTDGITDAEAKDGSMFGTCRLTALIEQGLDDDPPSLIDRIVAAVDNFSDHQPPTDDRTLVVARVS